jgi:hypothetical protein
VTTRTATTRTVAPTASTTVAPPRRRCDRRPSGGPTSPTPTAGWCATPGGTSSAEPATPVTVARSAGPRAYRLRPPPDPDEPPPRPSKAPWRRARQAKLRTEEAKAESGRRTWTVEPVFGIRKSALGFTRFHRRGLAKVKSGWQALAHADDCARRHELVAA